MARPGPKQEAHRRRAIGERRCDALQPDLRDLVDGKRQHVGRQSVAEPRQCVDQRRAMSFVVHQHDRPVRRRPRDRRSASRAACASAHLPAAVHRTPRRSDRRPRIGRSLRKYSASIATWSPAGVIAPVGQRSRQRVQPTIRERECAQSVVVEGDVAWLLESCRRGRAPSEPPAAWRRDCRDRRADSRRANRRAGNSAVPPVRSRMISQLDRALSRDGPNINAPREDGVGCAKSSTDDLERAEMAVGGTDLSLRHRKIGRCAAARSSPAARSAR